MFFQIIYYFAFLGPALGSALYNLGGFSLPFFSVGSGALLVAILLLVVVPNVTTDSKEKTDGGKSLTFSGLFRVRTSIVSRVTDSK